MAVEDIINYVEVNGVHIPEGELTPTNYFDFVKAGKSEITDEDLQGIADKCLKMLEGTIVTEQKTMAEKIAKTYAIILKEQKAVKEGYNIVIHRDTITAFIDKIDRRVVKLIEMKDYIRKIPRDVVAKVADCKSKDLFDVYYVLYTDYTGDEEKRVAKERRDKDPIIFGGFKSKDSNIPADRFFFIADWIDEYCDLTLEQMIEEYKEAVGEEVPVILTGIPKTVEELEEYIESIGNKSKTKSVGISEFGNVAPIGIETINPMDTPAPTEPPALKKRGRKKKVE